VDVGRAAVEALGTHLATTGRIGAAADVHFLTADELLDDRADRSAITRRRADHARFLRTDLPTVWRGAPTPVPIPDRTPAGAPASAGTVITGLGVSAGTTSGRVRVVHDLADGEFDVDEILVCRTTDPSWASIMAIAAGLVIDVGGAISHGAIVARELGIPCVIGTETGTAVLRDGDLVDIDGAAGTVTLRERLD
jgi:pyruvate,water dikinase